jgi:homoaconitase/3-isopropylmalate dehydratase large subunit
MWQFLNQNSGAITAIFSIVVGASTVAYAYLTGKLVSETRKMREAQTEPEISIIIEPRELDMNWIDIIIENTGLGIAKDITFQVEPDFEYMKDRFLSQKGFIKNGVKSLPPKGKRKYFLTGMGTGKEFEKKIKTSFLIKVSYQNSTRTKSYKQEYAIDFSELEGLIEVRKDRSYNLVSAINAIQAALKELTGVIENKKL